MHVQLGAYRIETKLGEGGGIAAGLAFDTRVQKRVWLLWGDDSQLAPWADALLDASRQSVLQLHDYNTASDAAPAHLALEPLAKGNRDDLRSVLPTDAARVAEWLAATPDTWIGETVTVAREQETRVVQLVGEGNIPQAVAQLSKGRYRLGELLGQGGMGKVYRAHDERLRRDVAIKVMIDVGEKDTRMRFHREARALGRVHHPNILEVIEYSGLASPVPYLVLELIGGATIAQVLQLARFPSTEALCVVADLADALAAVHKAGLVHRDIKPDNVFVDESGRVVLGDFGIVRGLEAGTDTGTFVRRSTEAIGSPQYASPEQVMNPDAVEQRSDVYSLGSFMFALLVGRSPYMDGNAANVLMKLARGEPIVYPPDTDAFCVKLMQKMLLHDLTQRPTARQVMELGRDELTRRNCLDRRARVRAFLGTSSGMTGHLGGSTTRIVALPAITAPQAKPKTPTHPAVYAVGGFVAAAILFAGVLFVMRPRAPEPAPVASVVVPLPPEPPASQPALPPPGETEVPSAIPREELEKKVVDRRPATVRFFTKPSATIFVDARHLGDTPFFNTTEMSPGTHKVRVENNPKFQPKELLVSVKPGETKDVRVELEKK